MAPPLFGIRSLAAMGVLLLVIQLFHPAMLISLEVGQTAAWLAVALGAGFTALMLWPLAGAIRRTPGHTLYHVANAAVGPWGAKTFAVLLSGMLAFKTALILRQSSEMAISAVFPHTPQTFATTALLLISLYVAMGDGSALVWLSRIFLPAVLVSLVVLYIGTIGWGEYRYLLPLFGPGPGPLLMGVPSVAATFGPLILLSILSGHLSDRRRLLLWFVAIPLIGGAIKMFVKMNLLMTFAYPVGRSITFPLHEATRLIIGGRFFERLEGLWLFLWVSGTIALLGAQLYAASFVFSQAFKLPRHRIAAPTFAVLALTLAFFTPDQAQTIVWHKALAPLFTAGFLIIPAVLALLALVRQRGAAG